MFTPSVGKVFPLMTVMAVKNIYRNIYIFKYFTSIRNLMRYAKVFFALLTQFLPECLPK